MQSFPNDWNRYNKLIWFYDRTYSTHTLTYTRARINIYGNFCFVYLVQDRKDTFGLDTYHIGVVISLHELNNHHSLSHIKTFTLYQHWKHYAAPTNCNMTDDESFSCERRIFLCTGIHSGCLNMAESERMRVQERISYLRTSKGNDGVSKTHTHMHTYHQYFAKHLNQYVFGIVIRHDGVRAR